MTLKTFTQTSHDSYDRHVYKLNIPGGKSVVIENYDILRAIWFEKCNVLNDCTVEVLDVTKKGNKGFS